MLNGKCLILVLLLLFQLLIQKISLTFTHRIGEAGKGSSLALYPTARLSPEFLQNRLQLIYACCCCSAAVSQIVGLLEFCGLNNLALSVLSPADENEKP